MVRINGWPGRPFISQLIYEFPSFPSERKGEWVTKLFQCFDVLFVLPFGLFVNCCNNNEKKKTTIAKGVEAPKNAEVEEDFFLLGLAFAE